MGFGGGFSGGGGGGGGTPDDNSVTSAKIVDGEVMEVDVGNNAITAAKIAANAVITSKILDANVTNPKLAADAVSTLKILDGAVTQAKLDGAVTTPPSGAAGGDLASTYPNPEVAAIHETGGPTKLTVGAIADGEFLKRVGSTLVSAANANGDVTGPEGATGNALVRFDSTTGKLIKDSGTTLADNGDLALAGILRKTQASVAATGTTRDTATLLTSQYSRITSGSPGLGNAVRLPDSRPAGELWAVTNYSEAYTGNGFFVWIGTTASGGTVLTGGGGALTFMNVRGKTTVYFLSLGSETWLAFSFVEPYNSNDRTISADTLRMFLGNIRLETGSYVNFGIAAMFTGGLSAARVISPKITGYSPSAATDNSSDRGKLFTNEGATGEVVFTLPLASTGLTYLFAVQAAFNLKVSANAADTIRLFNQVSAAAGFAESALVGSFLRLTAINATEWFAENVVGTWTVT